MKLEKLINTMIYNFYLPNEVMNTLKKDYFILTKNEEWLKIIKHIPSYDTCNKLPENKTIILDSQEILELSYDFFKQATNKEIFEQFQNIYDNNLKRFKFSYFNNPYLSGYSLYFSFFNHYYMQIYQSKTFSDVTTTNHEFGHLIQFFNNYHKNLFNEHYMYLEIVSIFLELLSNEYYIKQGYELEGINNSKNYIKQALGNLQKLKEEIRIIQKINANGNIKQNIKEVINQEDNKAIREILIYRPVQNYHYIIGLIIATNLLLLYKKDPEKAFNYLYQIINIPENKNELEYFQTLENLELTNAQGLNEYAKLVRSRQVKK